MLNCEISLPGIEPYPAAPTPAVSKTRVKLQGAVHQPDRRFDVLAKITQNVAGMGEYPRVVARDAKGLPSEVDRLTPVCIPRLCPAAYIKLEVAPRGQGEGGAVAWIALDRPPEQVDGLDDAVPFVREAVWERAQIEIIGVEIVRPTIGQSADLGGLQRRLDDTSDADRHLVLKLQDILHIAVEAVGPEMRPVRSVDQLRGDAHATACLAHAAFEHIAHAEFAPNLLHIDGAAFVGEARVAGDDEEPSYSGERSDDLLDHAVGKIFLLGVAAHVLEWQDRNRWLVRQYERRLR
jgi:hypothetical protein